jgi:Flp pilus assembly protein TadD
MQRLLAMLVALALTSVLSAHAQGSDDQYVQIYNAIQEAEQLEGTGQSNQALAKYLEAQTALQRFQRGHPDWNNQVVKFRLGYLESKIAGLSHKAAAPAPAAVASDRPSVKPRTEAENPFNAYNEQIRQLTAEKTLLEAKLKEALSSQPAAMDPRELVKAEDKVKSLQKENDLLKVSLNQARTKPAAVKESKSPPSVPPALAESNRKLTEQTEKANALALEKDALQKKLNSLMSSQGDPGALEASKKALDSSNKQLAEQKLTVSKIMFEKEALEFQVRSLRTSADTLASMRVENEKLKKQLSETKSKPRATTKPTTTERLLAQANSQIATLQNEKELLRLENVALENRLKQSPAPAVNANVTPALPQSDEAAARIKQLQQEKDEIQRQLEAALKKSSGRKGKPSDKQVIEMENQMAGLRARLDVFEAHRIPYTTEELALFKAPDTTLSASVDLKATRKIIKGPPPGSAPLVAEAQRFFANKQLDKAEERYLQVLHQDDKNVYTLGNLAAIQLELGHLPDAEKHITQAVALAPNDAYSLSILGYLRFRQQRYDDALDALSRAAKSEPENAEIQNYLGLTLGQKGMRGPAETALRKAIQIEPSYGSAHNNLAVVYLAQQPPSIELARWHYQKALATGHPRNPELEKMLEVKTVAEKGQ